MGFFSEVKQRIWPEINDLAAAQKAADQGFWAAIVSVTITTILILLNLSGANIFDLGLMNLIDVSLLVAVAFCIKKKIKIAPLIGALLYLLGQIVFIIEYKIPNVPMIIVFLVMYSNSYRGILAWHKIKKESDDEYNNRQVIPNVLGSVVLVVIMILGYFAVQDSESLNLPVIYTWSEASGELTKSVSEKVVFSEGEVPVYLFLDYPQTPLESGIVVTNQRFTVFGAVDGDFRIWPVHLSRVREVKKTASDAVLQRNTYSFTIDLGTEDSVMDFVLPHEKGRDEIMVTYIQNTASALRQ